MIDIKTPDTTKDISFTLELDGREPVEIDFMDENLIGYPMTVLECSKDEPVAFGIDEDDALAPKSTISIIYDEDEREYYAIHERDIRDPDYEILFELRLADKKEFVKRLTDYLNKA
ncbi:MAG: hypothetical protein HDQ88_04405 [Clostridia bacterium]|nr:hypothetical protein [Clostridia bacterium]